MRSTLLITLCLTSLWTDEVCAQNVSVTTGDRIRMTSPSVSGTYWVVGTSSDTLWLQAGEGAPTVVVSTATLGRLAVRQERSKGRGALRGMLIGSGFGTVAGGAIGVTQAEDLSQPHCRPVGFLGNTCRDEIDSFMLGAMIGFTAGLAVGAIGGSIWPGTRWERLPLPIHPGVRPADGGGLMLSFRMTL